MHWVDLEMDGTKFPPAENQELLFLSFSFGTLKGLHPTMLCGARGIGVGGEEGIRW